MITCLIFAVYDPEKLLADILSRLVACGKLSAEEARQRLEQVREGPSLTV